MDSLTHIVLGACIGEAVAGKELGRRAMVWGLIGQSFPDIDVVASFWMDTASNLLAHRGFTHSILGCALSTLLFALVAARMHKARGVRFKTLLLLFGIELFTHIFLDSQNAYGTGLFEPFSHARVSFNTMFVADPLFTIVAAIASFMLIFPRIRRNSRLTWAYSGIVCSTLYLSYCTFNKLRIDSEVKTLLKEQQVAYNNSFITPTPLNSMLWYVVLASDSGNYIGYRSVFDKQQNIPLTYFPRREDLLENAEDNESTQKLIRFSQGFYTAEKWQDTLVFNDLRFGQMGGWVYPEEKFVFHYYLKDSADNATVIQRGRFTKWDWSVVTALMTRIKGN